MLFLKSAESKKMANHVHFGTQQTPSSRSSLVDVCMCEEEEEGGGGNYRPSQKINNTKAHGSVS